MLSARSLEIIKASQGWRRNRVEHFELPEGRVVVKGQRPLRGPWAHRLLNGIATLAGVACLKAVPVHGGALAQKVEVRRLQDLSAAGVRVPRLWHVAEDFIVMEDLGQNNLIRLIDQGGEAARVAWQRCAHYLLEVHRAGQYLSQCFARNIMVLPHEIGAIDFEDDPLEVMSLPDAQARDWLIFLQSSLWALDAPPSWVDAQLDAWLGQETPEVQRALGAAIKRLAWLRHLSDNRKLWGRDGISARATAAFLYRYHLRHV
ncbi:hypothetical protein [Tepidicella baoligensis]|uniref:hypothetical protein n=1 Tax=Tepidicella baoligensis TaxID=2707016 RepID=UPI0015DAB4D0|nr:hypothetical protein [Tepidicella baoligensis]